MFDVWRENRELRRENAELLRVLVQAREAVAGLSEALAEAAMGRDTALGTIEQLSAESTWTPSGVAS